MKNIWKKFCAWVSDIWRKFVNWLLGIPASYRFFFVAGIVLTAFAQITLHIEWCPALVVGLILIYEFIKQWVRDGYKFNFWNVVACSLGALVIWADVLLGKWWFGW